jgi:hypothetical protein
MARGIVDLLGTDPAAVAPARAAADAGAAGAELRKLVGGDDGLVAGLGLDVQVRDGDPDEVATGLLSAAVRFADEPPAEDVASYAVLRTAVEAAAAEIAAGADRIDRREPVDGRGAPTAVRARRHREDALDLLIAEATRRGTP